MFLFQTTVKPFYIRTYVLVEAVAGSQRFAFWAQQYVEGLCIGTELVSLQVAPTVANGAQFALLAVFVHYNGLRQWGFVVNVQSDKDVFVVDDVSNVALDGIFDALFLLDDGARSGHGARSEVQSAAGLGGHFQHDDLLSALGNSLQRSRQAAATRTHDHDVRIGFLGKKGAVAAFAKASEFGQKAAADKQIGTIYLKAAVAAYKAKNHAATLENVLKSNEYGVKTANLYGGMAAFNLKKYDQCISLLEGDNSTNAKYYLARAYEAKGDNAKACENYKAIATDKNFGAYATSKVGTLCK